MLQAEYDYELDIEVQREEAYEDGLRVGEQTGEKRGIQKGIQKGMQEKEIALIIKKVRRGKNLETIAEELEEPVNEIRKIYETVVQAAPEYDVDMIIESLAEK